MKEMLNSIIEKISKDEPRIIVIDGRCASGKSTLANELKKHLGCDIVCTDHFFLRPFQRTMERLKEPGGNIDYERFEKEVLPNLIPGKEFSYTPYNCQTREMGEPIHINFNGKIIIEGAYGIHPRFNKYYDLSIFLSTNLETQIDRIKQRNPKMIKNFIDKWIPLEEDYLKFYDIKGSCDMVFIT